MFRNWDTVLWQYETWVRVGYTIASVCPVFGQFCTETLFLIASPSHGSIESDFLRNRLLTQTQLITDVCSFHLNFSEIEKPLHCHLSPESFSYYSFSLSFSMNVVVKTDNEIKKPLPITVYKYLERDNLSNLSGSNFLLIAANLNEIRRDAIAAVATRCCECKKLNAVRCWFGAWCDLARQKKTV